MQEKVESFSAAKVAARIRVGQALEGASAIADAMEAADWKAMRLEQREGECCLITPGASVARSVDVEDGLCVNFASDGAVCGVSFYLE